MKTTRFLLLPLCLDLHRHLCTPPTRLDEPAPPPNPVVPPPSPFANLPLETIGRIVDLVAEQDKRWGHYGQDMRRSTGHEYDFESGEYPSSSGRGIACVSTVNKSLRALCLPHLVKVSSPAVAVSASLVVADALLQ